MEEVVIKEFSDRLVKFRKKWAWKTFPELEVGGAKGIDKKMGEAHVGRVSLNRIEYSWR